MLYIIDGTGEESDYEYEKSMSSGFCYQLSKKACGIYLRGPTALGLTTFRIADAMLSAIDERQKSDKSEPIFLAGHSRGGAAAIYVAQKLKQKGKFVKAMFLFDAVDRTISLWRDVQTIPNNVINCYHAVRDTSISEYYSDGAKLAAEKFFACLESNSHNTSKCDQLRQNAANLIDQDRKMKMTMRTNIELEIDVKWKGMLPSINLDSSSLDFGNCGTKAEPGCNLVTEKFMGSHGALGGSPIIDERAPKLLIDSDRAAIASVDAWMSSKLIVEGVLGGGKVLQ